jgi:hypothetical protein
MIVEQRDYTIVTGRLAEFVKRTTETGIKIQAPILGNLLGWFTSEIGELNHVVHMWGYDDYAERERRRTALYRDAAWIAYLPSVMPLIAEMRTRILIPSSFSPIR